jgi:hypothetical protein
MLLTYSMTLHCVTGVPCTLGVTGLFSLLGTRVVRQGTWHVDCRQNHAIFLFSMLCHDHPYYSMEMLKLLSIELLIIKIYRACSLMGNV